MFIGQGQREIRKKMSHKMSMLLIYYKINWRKLMTIVRYNYILVSLIAFFYLFLYFENDINLLFELLKYWV